MFVRPLTRRLDAYLVKHHLQSIYKKQVDLFKRNPRYPGLHTELLEPRTMGIYSFRVTRKYRAIFVYCGDGTVEIVDINNHYDA